LLHGLDGRVEGPSRESIVDVAESQERPRQQTEHEGIEPRRARRHDSRDVAIGHERAVENGVVAARRTHAEDIPGLLDAVPFRVPRHERMYHLWRRRIRDIHPVNPEIGPDGCEAAERFAAGEPVASVDAFRSRRRQQNRNVVAALSVASGKDSAADGFFQQPPQRRVAGAEEIGGHAAPVQMHVDREGGGWGVVREPALFADGIG
jgi:hypothetical protein